MTKIPRALKVSIMNRPLFVLALALFATMLGNGIVMPFMPLYAQQFSASGAVMGALFGAHSAARTFLLPFIGRASDRHGRKTFLLGGLLFYTITSIAYLLANSLGALFLVMALQGIATAMVQPVALAYVADLTPKGRKVRTLVTRTLPLWRESLVVLFLAG